MVWWLQALGSGKGATSSLLFSQQLNVLRGGQNEIRIPVLLFTAFMRSKFLCSLSPYLLETRNDLSYLHTVLKNRVW